VEQAEIVADEAGGNVDDRAPAPLVEQPAVSQRGDAPARIRRRHGDANPSAYGVTHVGDELVGALSRSQQCIDHLASESPMVDGSNFCCVAVGVFTGVALAC